jgi:predicted transcriptional regulator of viral defense system
MREESANADRVVAETAARQHGVITFDQLVRAGLDKSAIQRRIRAARLHRIHRGVYAVGHKALSNEGRWMAAVLACGEGAALSHRSAAELWDMLRAREYAWVHVTVPTSAGRRRRRGIHLHRSPLLQSGTLTTKRRGIRVTTPARTLADLAKTTSAHELNRATRQAEFLGLPLDEPTDRTRSDLEALFLRICARHGIPRPEVNVKLDPYTVDFLWRDQRVIVEVDGWQAHRGRRSFRDDRERDIDLGLRGFTVRRFADTTLNDDPAGVGRAVQRFLTENG